MCQMGSSLCRTFFVASVWCCLFFLLVSVLQGRSRVVPEKWQLETRSASWILGSFSLISLPVAASLPHSPSAISSQKLDFLVSCCPVSSVYWRCCEPWAVFRYQKKREAGKPACCRMAEALSWLHRLLVTPCWPASSSHTPSFQQRLGHPQLQHHPTRDSLALQSCCLLRLRNNSAVISSAPFSLTKPRPSATTLVKSDSAILARFFQRPRHLRQAPRHWLDTTTGYSHRLSLTQMPTPYVS